MENVKSKRKYLRIIKALKEYPDTPLDKIAKKLKIPVKEFLSYFYVKT